MERSSPAAAISSPEYGVRLPQKFQLIPGDVAQYANGQTGAGEGLAPHEILGNSQFNAGFCAPRL